MLEFVLALSFAVTLPTVSVAGILLVAGHKWAAYRLQRRELDLRWLATLHLGSDLLRDAPAWVDRNDPVALLRWAEAEAEAEVAGLVEAS